MRPIPLAVAAALAALALSGCLLGGEARTEWAYEAVQLEQAARQGLTGAGVVVAVLDTGIDAGHPSLRHLTDNEAGRLVAYRDFYTGREGIDHAQDPDGHGTHVISIISGRGSSLADKISYGGVELRGGAPAVDLVVARVCDGGSCKAEAIADAIRWAAFQEGAQVISLSLGGQSRLPPGLDGLIQGAIERAVNDAIDRGVVVVASAGNEGPDNQDVSTPASIPRVIAVGAVAKDLRVWDQSSRGAASGCPGGGALVPGFQGAGRCYPDRKPEIVAPGVDIRGAWSGGGYAQASGTSQATPFVTSAVALMLEGRAPLGTAGEAMELKRALIDAARPLEGQRTPHDAAAGYGLLQAHAAVRAYQG